MSKEARINFAISEARKEQWEEAQEADPNTEYLSQLIRLAVEQYLNDDSSDDAALPDDLETELRDLSSSQQTLLQRFDEMRSQLNDIREAVSTADPEVEALANRIFQQLPTESTIESDSVFDQDGPAPGTVEWLNDRVDASTYRIEAALRHLQTTTYAVHQSGDQYYRDA